MALLHAVGIKNQFRLDESDFYKIPSMKEVDLGNQPTAYEAYLYLIKDIINMTNQLNTSNTHEH